jgi:membrane dipeptidase
MKLRWIDGHLDLAYGALCGRDLRVPCPDPKAGCVSLPSLREASVEIALGTIFTAPGDDHGEAGYDGPDDLDGAEAAGLKQLAVYEQLEAEGELSIVRSAADLDGDGPLPKIVILMEGGDPIRSPDHVGMWHERGLRFVGLSWAAGTRYAGGNAVGGPLTPLGIEMIKALDVHGIVHDASHLGDAALDGLLEHATGRIVATHSNCRALVEDRQRHLRDDQIDEIAKRQGVVGLNLFTKFLAVGRRATIADCVDHVQHVAEVMGHRRGVALGSDMDGGFPPTDLPGDLDHPSKLRDLAEALRDAEWGDADIDGFALGNWRRVLREALGDEK